MELGIYMTQSFFSLCEIRDFRITGLSGAVTHMIYVKYAKYFRVILAFKSGKVGFFTFPESSTATSTKAIELPDGHNGAITAVLNCGREGRPKEEGWQIFTGGVDGTVRLWVLWGENAFGSDPRTENGAQIQVLRGHRGSVTSLAMLGEPDQAGARLYSGSLDGTIIEWQRSKHAVGLRFPSFHSSRIFRFFEPSTSWPSSLVSLSDIELLVGDSTGALHLLDIVNMDMPLSPTSNASAVSVSGSGRLRRLANDHALSVDSLQLLGTSRVLVSGGNEGTSCFYIVPDDEKPSIKAMAVKSAGHERQSGSLQAVWLPSTQPGGGTSQLVLLLDKIDARVAAAVELTPPQGSQMKSSVQLLQQKVGACGEGPGPWNFCGVPPGLLTGFPGSESSLGVIMSANSTGVSFHSIRSEVSLPSLCEPTETSAVVWLGVVESAASGCLSSCLVAAHESGRLKFWDLDGSVQKPIAVMNVGSKQMSSLTSAFLLPDLSCVLTGHDNGVVLQWPLTRSFEARPRALTPHSHTNTVTAFARSRTIIASCGIGGRVNFWRSSVNDGAVTLPVLKRENLQPVMVDPSGILCAVYWRGAFVLGSNAGKLFEVQGLGDSFEQIKAAECTWWSQSASAVVAVRTFSESELLVADASRRIYLVAGETLAIRSFGAIASPTNFAFWPLVVDGRRLFVAGTDGAASMLEIPEEGEAKHAELGRVEFALSAAAAHKNRVFFGAENGRIVVVDV